jgi:hypothetical protein
MKTNNNMKKTKIQAHDDCALLPSVIAEVVFQELYRYAPYIPPIEEETAMFVLEFSRKLYLKNAMWNKVMRTGNRDKAYAFIRHWVFAFVAERVPKLRVQWQRDRVLQKFALGVEIV